MMYIDKMIEQVSNLIDMGYWIDPILILFFIYTEDFIIDVTDVTDGVLLM